MLCAVLCLFHAGHTVRGTLTAANVRTHLRFDVDHVIFGMLSAILRLFSVSHAVRRTLTEATMRTLLCFHNVDHAILRVQWAVFLVPATPCEMRLLQLLWVHPILVNVDQTVTGVLFAVFLDCGTSHAKLRLLAAATVGTSLTTSTIIPSSACCVQYFCIFVPGMPNDGRLLQPPLAHLLLRTSTLSSLSCCAQYGAVLVPATRYDTASCCSHHGHISF